MVTCHSCGTTVRVDVFVTPAGAIAECDRCLFDRIPPQAPVVGPFWTANEDHFGGITYTR